MAAAAQNGVIQFRGRSGRTYSKSIYVSDVVAALVNWATGGVAASTSETFWSPPEPVLLEDVSFVTGLTDTSNYELIRNGVATGDVFNKGIHDDGIATRPQLSIPFNPGDKIHLIQRA